MRVKIITDSATDLPQEIINNYNLEVMPLMVIDNGEEYKEGEIKPVELYNAMREGKIYKTSQVPVKTMKDTFTKYAKEGQDVIYIAFSSQLSGTYQSAVVVKEQVLEEYPDFNIDIIDSKCASLGFGMVVYKVAKLAKAGKSKQELIAAVNFYKDHMEHIFTVDNLEYLYRGGRVSKTSAFVGGLLNIKPILEVEDGKLIPLEKKKGRKKTFKRIIELIGERGVDLANQTIAISHGDDLEGAHKLQDMIKDKFGTQDFVINMIGAVIGAHSGPGTLAVFFLNEVM